MSTLARIELAALREQADHADLECNGECSGMFTRNQVLALVHAVEAARAVLDEFEMVVPPAASGLPGDAPWIRAQRHFREALERFA